RATAMRSAALKEWAARSRLQRGWLDWRAWVLRRAREAVLGSGRRHALLLGMQVLQGWRLTTLCSSFARLRVVPRLAQQTLLAWRGEAAGSGLRRAADRAAEAHLLQLTVCSWQSVLAQGREGRQLADAHHFRRLAAMRRLSFTVWHELQLSSAHLSKLLPLVEVSADRKLLMDVLLPWRSWASRVHRTVGAAVAVTRRVTAAGRRQALRNWQRAVALHRVPELQEAAEARERSQALALCFSAFAQPWADRRAAAASLAERRPEIVEKLAELLARGSEWRRQGLDEWHGWAGGRRRQRAQGLVVQRCLSLSRASRAMSLWEVRRARIAMRARRAELVNSFLRADVGGLQACSLRTWREATVDARRYRLGCQIAESAFGDSLLRKVWQSWAARARRSATARAAFEAVDEAAKRLLWQQVLQGWLEWRRRAAALRRGAELVAGRLARRCVRSALGSWVEVANTLASLETRYLLQVDDFRRRARRRAWSALLAGWHAAAAVSRETCQQARLGKVFACWRLAAQEQLLLRRYLQECSAANFKGKADRRSEPKTGSVGPSDLEKLYRQMAEQRWDASELLSD
ncbi:unnamed protein product, partial [Polarella glacialis]